MSKIVLVTRASTELGAATALALAGAGHTAYAGIGPAAGSSPGGTAELERHALVQGTRLRPLGLDVADQRSVSVAVREITAESGRIDAVIHTVGPVPRGPLESFTPYQLAQIYDAYVLSTQRVNRAVLPHMRERQDGLLVWAVPSGHPADRTPYLALHSEAVTLIEHFAASYARELAGFGIEVSTVVSRSCTADAGRHLGLVHPDDTETTAVYDSRYPGLVDSVDAVLAQQTVTEADIARTAEAIAMVVDSAKGSRPLRIAPGAGGAPV
ncbi:short-chain dehydrogenase/reductase [Streptomyces sulfonofaciens]|uniref:Short-chain dehydrogenase/reductase n=1 Tax=Streptomyces sulfonofaciens TaxID=68272 RepID=A0A919GMV7_9ACTN|nr:SDR family NAD(P)-dependent oxidoreductase [Streptomyces sulfonofaciens]GHH87089.1 short-chain dehydrogenase/reductase [Streptomyces sulfonofaciens]